MARGSRQPGFETATSTAKQEALQQNIRERGYDRPSSRQPGIDISVSPRKQQALQEGIASLQSEMADRRRRGETRQDVGDYLRIHSLNRWGDTPRDFRTMNFLKKFHRPYKKISDLPPGILEMLMKEPGMTEDNILNTWWALPEFTRQEMWKKHGKPTNVQTDLWKSKINVRPGYTEKKSPWELEDLREQRMKIDPPWGMANRYGNFMFTKPFGEDGDSVAPMALEGGLSDLDKATIFGHEVRHDVLSDNPELWGSQPEWVQKVEQPGTSEQKQFGAQYLAGHELYNRFLDERFFPSGTRPKTINEPYFDKILSDYWEPSAKEYERISEAPEGGYGQSPTGSDIAGTPFSRGGILGAF